MADIVTAMKIEAERAAQLFTWHSRAMDVRYHYRCALVAQNRRALIHHMDRAEILVTGLVEELNLKGMRQ